MSDSEIWHHAFTKQILEVLKNHYGDAAEEILSTSQLLGYLNHKTKSANRGSKSRGSFANHYALYVLVEDYIKSGFAEGGKNHGKYSEYEGARFSTLFARQRELPFGRKLQNHALNSRLNDEFHKFYPTVGEQPIIRDVANQRYWVNENLLNVKIRGKDGKKHIVNLARVIVEIIDRYVTHKREAFEAFINTCKEIEAYSAKDAEAVKTFIESQLQPNVDARVFEIISFSVLKAFYSDKMIVWGWSWDDLGEQNLELFKTGRTNANDGGIDFVMRPVGRFFQVTETVDANKYFLDIDKIQRFPLTFVVKSSDTIDKILKSIETQASTKYKIKAVVKSYMDAVEEVINIPQLLDCLNEVVKAGKVGDVMQEVVLQSRVEFNVEEE